MHNVSTQSKDILWGAFILAACGAALGMICNALSPQRIPLSYRAARALIISRATGGWDIARVAHITLRQAKAAFDRKSAIFVDARGQKEYQRSHIKGALLLPAVDFDRSYRRLVKRLPKHARIIVYCAGAGCLSSEVVAAKLQQRGYTNVSALVGGWVEWKRAKYPIQAQSTSDEAQTTRR